MKLGVKVKENGTLTVIDVKTGEEVEGQQFVEVESGIETATTIHMQVLAYDKNGKEAAG